ncbi:MAG: copper resistance protein CopC [Candidatus Promineifilaceae bacterium]
MKIRSSHLALVLTVVFLFVVFVSPAQAHANLLQSIPEANAQLDRPPVKIELFFSEPIEAAFSTIQVLNGSGQRMDNDDAQVDPADPTHMTATVRSLPDGIYLVSWRNLSSVDSHILEGVFPFAVGNVDAAALADAAEASRQIKVSPGEIIARWLTFISMMALVGGSLFILMIWEPAVRLSGIGRDLEPRWSWIPHVGILVLLTASIFWLLLQGGHAAGAEFAAPWNPVVGQVLFTTRFGMAWIGRILLGMALLLYLPKAKSRRERWISLGIGVLLLFTVSFGSHGAAQPNPIFPILADLIHLTAASVWIGGLLYFLIGLRAVRELDGTERPKLTAVLIPRFSALGLTSVATLTLTGLYASLLHVGTIDKLLSTVYGRALIIKLALVVPMVMLGAINLLVTTPNMKLAAEKAVGSPWVGRFRRLVTSELTLGLAVFLSVAVLTTLSPAEFPGDTSDLSGTQDVDDLQISLDVSPGRPGLNTFTATITQDGQPLTDVREVELQFTPTTVDLPPGSAQLDDQGNGVYSIQGGFLTLPDAYQLQVAVRRTDAFDAFANFNFSVGTTAPAAQNFAWYRVSGVLLVVTGLLSVLALQTLIHRRRQTIAFGGVSALALAVVGVMVLLNPPISEGGNLPVNPIPPNADSVAAGGELYQQNCFPCHGASGKGDGPVGQTLNPPPADLTIHTQPGVHPDGRLYNWITNGFPDSVMPAFKEKLTDEERWNLVNYIRTLAQPQ